MLVAGWQPVSGTIRPRTIDSSNYPPIGTETPPIVVATRPKRPHDT
ncbi:hypothetical protein NJ7G_4052 [Natrinema sp. J7-2]|nr:hypothetical protein NJ7G_4052 [Natrinema sp. J7-2]